MNTINNEIYPPEYANRRVVVIVPMAALPTRSPDRMASGALISGFLPITSQTAEVMSTARSIMAPDAPINMLAIKIEVRSKSW